MDSVQVDWECRLEGHRLLRRRLGDLQTWVTQRMFDWHPRPNNEALPFPPPSRGKMVKLRKGTYSGKSGNYVKTKILWPPRQANHWLQSHTTTWARRLRPESVTPAVLPIIHCNRLWKCKTNEGITAMFFLKAKVVQPLLSPQLLAHCAKSSNIASLFQSSQHFQDHAQFCHELGVLRRATQNSPWCR